MEEIRFETDCDISAIHFHDELELFYVLSGRAGIMLTGSNYMLEQEGFIVFNPFQNHEIYREAGCHTKKYGIRPIKCSRCFYISMRIIRKI